MKVINHLLCFDSTIAVLFRKSPNIGGKLNPSYLIIHYDGSTTAEGAIQWMTTRRKKDNVSAHLHIGRDGKIVQMVPFNVVAWHAGVSSWKGLIGMNSHSIGIELQNTGNQVYTEAQLNSLTEVSKALVEAYGLKEILGHSDIAPGRKVDPGALFPMAKLRFDVYGGGHEKPVGQQKEVTAESLNVRSGAGTNFPIIGGIKKGTLVNIIETQEDWSEVLILASGSKGWISNKYLK